jgi:hypothetical protein
MTKIKFFADHCISNYIINSLREEGFEVYRLRDHIPKDSPDTVVILKAQELSTVLISLNGDFNDITTVNGVIGLNIPTATSTTFSAKLTNDNINVNNLSLKNTHFTRYTTKTY